MALTKGKHIVKEIDGVLCTVVETGISKERLNFLKELLEFNKYEVKTEKDEAKAKTEVKGEGEALRLRLTLQSKWIPIPSV